MIFLLISNFWSWNQRI